MEEFISLGLSDSVKIIGALVGLSVIAANIARVIFSWRKDQREEFEYQASIPIRVKQRKELERSLENQQLDARRLTLDIQIKEEQLAEFMRSRSEPKFPPDKQMLETKRIKLDLLIKREQLIELRRKRTETKSPSAIVETVRKNRKKLRIVDLSN